MSSRHGWLRGLLVSLVGTPLLGAIAYLLVLALQGANLVKVDLATNSTGVHFHDARTWLIVAFLAGALALAAWARAERRLHVLERTEADLAERERAARDAAEQTERHLQESERKRNRLEQEHQRERESLAKVARAWRSEREWNRELREQIMRMQQTRGILGRHDPREMILQLTVELVEAQKGLLLSRREQTPNGRMEVVCAVGFDSDPQDSRVAQRFAEEVIERGTTVREDDSSQLDAEKRSAADEEVKNLLAIPIYLHDQFDGVIVCVNREQGFEDLEDDVLLAVGDHAGAVLQNSRLHGQLRTAYLATVRMLASAIEVKDPDLRGHSDAVSEYVMAVADQLDFEPHRREELIFGSLLHDVGKLGISERILLKPGPLTDEERSVMQLHPRIGYHLIRQIPALGPIAPAVLHHHERYDGDGYPGRLRGEAIPIEARIIAVADAFSAMTVERPYSRPRTVEDACAELERCAGEQFDPQVVRLFVEEVRRRPPSELEPELPPPDPELELHREPGDFVLGGRSFGITDSLTLLYSHRHFHETAHGEAQRAIVQKRPFGIVIGRLVGLEALNLERGFDAGDSALQAVGDAFRSAAARADGLAFRVSGRRLGLIAPKLDDAGTQRLVSELASELSNGSPVQIGGAAWRPGESGEQVIERALRELEQLAESAVSRPRAAS